VSTRLPWAVFALLVLGNLGFVARYGGDIPRSDEWVDAAVLLGDEDFAWRWLWRPHSAHRIALPRLVRLVLYRATGDFRAALFFNVAAMSVAAAVLLRALARRRGSPCGRDVLVPLLLLGPGHYMNFLWGFQVQFALSCALFVGMLAVLLTAASAPGAGSLAVFGALLLAQLLTGANGVALALPLLVWLAAALASRRAEGGALRTVALVLAGVSAAVAAVYPLGLRDPASPPTTAAAAAAAALQFLSTSLGATVGFWKIRAVLVALLAAATLVILARACRRDPAERWRAAGLAAGCISVLLLAAFVGVGRGELTLHPGIQDRYLTLAVPVLLLCYIGFSLYGGPAARRVVPAGLVVATVLSMAVSGPQAVGYGEFRKAQLDALRRDVDRGLPLEAIAARNASAIFQYSTGVEAHLRRLLARRAWPFARYRADPRLRPEAVRRIPLALDAFDGRDLRADGGGYRPTGPAPRLLLRLPGPKAVAGVELRYSLDGPSARLLRLEMRWAVARGGTPVFPLSGQRASYPVRAAAGPRTLTVWTYDTLDTLALEPDRLAWSFTVHEAVLLELPADWMAHSAQRGPGVALADGDSAGPGFAWAVNSLRRRTSSR
jgi:hypothetical protein